MPKANTAAASAAPEDQQPLADQSNPLPPDDATPSLVKVRVLAACEYGAPNDVVEIDSALAATMTDVVDADPAAVQYAESLKA